MNSRLVNCSAAAGVPLDHASDTISLSFHQEMPCHAHFYLTLPYLWDDQSYTDHTVPRPCWVQPSAHPNVTTVTKTSTMLLQTTTGSMVISYMAAQNVGCKPPKQDTISPQLHTQTNFKHHDI